jgi:serpin B
MSVCIAAANAASPKRPMLEQGKTWEYIYHHYESLSEPGPDGKDYAVTTWMSYYRLNGDTIINGRQYMKMYRSDWNNPKEKYVGAFREDEEGRVYVTDYSIGIYDQEKEFKIIDFSLDFDEDIWHTETTSTETIKVNGKYFNRYRYQNALPFPDSFIGVEGVGYQRYGIAHYLFEPIPTCICDYEELYSVSCKDFYFSASDFDAPKEIELADGEQELINSNNDFAFNLFRKARGDKSKILSPLSITFALGMLNNGADGQTLQEINQTLGFGEAGADAINAFCQKMLKESNTLDERTEALIANTIFVNEGCDYHLQEGFIDKANTYYDAQPQNRNFADGETMNVINQWASDHTMGMIPKVLNEDSFNPGAASYLLNALYFKGMWSSPFRKENTQDEPFGGGEEVPMMHKNDVGLLYAENDLYQAVRLPYGNGAYRMDVFLPREDKTVGEVLETLSGSHWQPEYRQTDVDLKLPRFESDTNQDLVGVMSDLGMPKAFTPEADFPYFCNGVPYIGKMSQVAKIKLDEEGTEAAAVTVIEMTESAPPMEPTPFHANRPFLYIISEQSTGAIFFIGQYTGGVSADIRNGIIATKAEPKTSANNLIYNLSGQRLSQEPARGLYIKNGKVMIK